MCVIVYWSNSLGNTFIMSLDIEAMKNLSNVHSIIKIRMQWWPKLIQWSWWKAVWWIFKIKNNFTWDVFFFLFFLIFISFLTGRMWNESFPHSFFTCVCFNMCYYSVLFLLLLLLFYHLLFVFSHLHYFFTPSGATERETCLQKLLCLYLQRELKWYFSLFVATFAEPSETINICFTYI